MSVIGVPYAPCGNLYQSTKGAFPLYLCDLDPGHAGEHECIGANFSWPAADGFWPPR